MPIVSVQYRFRQPFRVPAQDAFDWCTDFGPSDGPLFSVPTRRTVRWLNDETVILTDTRRPEGRPRTIDRLVRIRPRSLAWTNTHLTGPYRFSQFWYRVIRDGPRRSHLDFTGLQVETRRRRLSAADVARRSEELRRTDSTEWRTRLAPALERELGAK